MNWKFAMVGVFIATGLFMWWRGAPAILDIDTSVSVATSTISAETDVYTVKADYPVFGIPALDVQILEAVQAGVASLEGQPANPSPNNTKNEFVSTFDSVYIGDDYTSARLLLYQYTGGAHGATVAVGVSYERATQRLLTLEDALALTGKSLEDISQMADEQITAQHGEVFFPDGIEPRPENFATFVVNEEAVVFTLQQYQAVPYAFGMPEIVVTRAR